MVYAWPFENLHGFCILLFVLFFLGFEFFSCAICFGFWVLICILLWFKLEITRWFWLVQSMTHATGFDPNFQSVAGPYSVHSIQSGRMRVNPKPNLTWPMCDDSPSWNTSSWCVSSILTKRLPCTSRTQIGVGMCFLDLGSAMVPKKKAFLY